MRARKFMRTKIYLLGGALGKKAAVTREEKRRVTMNPGAIMVKKEGKGS